MALLVVAMSIVLFGIAAIVVDLGFARDLETRAKSTADAAALAGASCMAFSASGCATDALAQARADAYVSANGWSAGATYVWNDAAGTVAVTLNPVRSPGFLAPVIGAGEPLVGASATATWKNSAALTCALCVIGNYDGQVGSALVVRGNAAIGGNLTFNNANGFLGADAVGYGTFWNGNGTIVPPPVRLTTTVRDPYAALQLPPPEVDPGPVVSAGTGVCSPGQYTDVSGCTSFTGNGNYVITGGPRVGMIGINASAANSMFYLTCYTLDGSRKPHYSPCSAPGASQAQLMGAGNTDVTLSAPTSGTYAGFALVVDRTMSCSPPSCQESLVGNAKLTVTGTVYAPSVTVTAAGNGCYWEQGNTVVGGVSLAGVGSGGPGGCGTTAPNGSVLHIQINGSAVPVSIPGTGGPVRLIR